MKLQAGRPWRKALLSREDNRTSGDFCFYLVFYNTISNNRNTFGHIRLALFIKMFLLVTCRNIEVENKLSSNVPGEVDKRG